MRRFTHVLRLSAILALVLCGCRNGVRMARMVVEADGIGRNLNTLNRAVDAEIADHSRPDH